MTGKKKHTTQEEGFEKDDFLTDFHGHQNSYRQSEEQEIINQFKKIDPIRIYDTQQNEINYGNLNMEEKQEVLAELLFHSVLNNIKNQRTVSKIHEN